VIALNSSNASPVGCRDHEWDAPVAFMIHLCHPNGKAHVLGRLANLELPKTVRADPVT
jgi:hypothetical protein